MGRTRNEEMSLAGQLKDRGRTSGNDVPSYQEKQGMSEDHGGLSTAKL